MRAFVLKTKANEANDMGVHEYLIKALDVDSIEVIQNYGSAKDLLKPFDGPGHVFVAMIYAFSVGFKKEWLPSADKIVIYNQGDYQFADSEVPVVEQIQDKKHSKSILAPYKVRKSFIKETENIGYYDNPVNDVIFVGLESRKMAFVKEIRAEYLDRFHKSVKGRFNFFRYQVHPALSIRDYAQVMQQGKISLVVNGCSEHTFRYFEALHLGTCVVAQKFSREVMWCDPGKIVPTFNTPEEGADLCADLISSGAWWDYRKKQREWYLDCHNENAYKQWAADAASKIYGGRLCAHVADLIPCKKSK